MLSAENLFIFLAILVSVLFFGLGFKDIAEFILLLAVVVFAFWTAASKKATMSELNAMMAQAFSHELAVQTYTEKRGDLGKLLVVIKSQSAHLAKVIARIDNTAAQVARESEHGVKLSGYTAKLIQNQQAETLHVATEINEMTITIAQVSKHVADTATDADSAAKLTERGNLVSQQTHQAIIKLQQTVQAMGGL